MKSTGVLRKVDELGRIVIPKSLRNTLGLEEGTPIEIFTEGKEIILRKYNPGCNCCKNVTVKATVQGIDLCEECLNKFAKALELIDGARTNG